jgi:uncharacterized surface protein with fasciclin (FAS1) repeats
VTITAASVNIQFVFPTDPSTAATIQSTANSFTSAAALQSAIVAQLTTPVAIESTGGGSLAVTRTGAAVTVDLASVTTADLLASNGVVHVVNAVLLPSITPCQQVPITHTLKSWPG